MRRHIKGYLVLFLLAAPFLGRAGDELQIETSLPLGMAFDGKVLWVNDIRLKTITGYHLDEKTLIRPKAVTITAMRDLAFYFPHLVTVYPSYIALINPINGDVVERIQASRLVDPVSVAVDGDIAYISDRASKKIHRYNFKEKNFFGAIDLPIAQPRGMTFFKGYLWLVDREGRVHKIHPTTGEVLSFIPIPADSYGVTFINGMLYVSRPNIVQTVDYIETDTYVASLAKRYDLRGKIEFSLPWPQEQRQKETKLEISFKSLPFGARQRHQKLRVSPANFRFQRVEGGESSSQIDFTHFSETQYALTASFTIYELTHIFNSITIKEYYKKVNLPDEVLPYIKKGSPQNKSGDTLKQAAKKLRDENEGRHPIYILPKLSEYGFNTNDEQIFALRSLGIPARMATFFNAQSHAMVSYLQIYVPPVGWVTQTPAYNPNRPQEFPVSNQLLEVWYPETLQVNPPPHNEKNEILPIADDALRFVDLVLTERDATP